MFKVTLLTNGGYITLKGGSVGKQFTARPIVADIKEGRFLEGVLEVYVPIESEYCESRDSYGWLAFTIGDECEFVLDGEGWV